MQQLVHKFFPLRFSQTIPIQSPLGALATQLSFGKPHPFVVPCFGFLGQSQECLTLAGGGQLAHQRKHLIVG